MAEKAFAVLPVHLGQITSGNEKANRPAEHLALLDYPGMVWQSDGNGNLWVRGQFFEQEAIDFVSLISANALPGTTIRVRLGTTQAQVDGSGGYDSGTRTFISPALTVPNGLYHSHLELISIRIATWWRIDIGGHTGDFQAAGLVMGKRLTPSDFHDRDFEKGIDDLGKLNVSLRGVASEEPGIVMRTMTFRYSYMAEAEYENDFGPLVETIATRGICYWCISPDSYRQQSTYLGYLSRPAFARGTALDAKVSVEFAIRSWI